MFRRSLALVSIIGASLAAQSPVREVTLADFRPRRPVPIFDKGYLIQPDESRATISVYGPDGSLLYETDVLAPDGTAAHARNGAVDSDGTVAIPIWYGKRGNYRGGIIFLDPGGRQVRFLETGYYHPSALCFGPDHSLWAIGDQRRPVDIQDSADYPQVRRYSTEWKETGRFLPRSLFPPGLSPFGDGISRVWALSDRIGILGYPGKVSDHPEWVELDLEGKLIGRWKLGPTYTSSRHVMEGGFAFMAGGVLFARPLTLKPEIRVAQLMVFDKMTSTWKLVTSAAPQCVEGLLLGADGDKLVCEKYGAEGVHLFLVPPGGSL
jgi:hypothetical protein